MEISKAHTATLTTQAVRAVAELRCCDLKRSKMEMQSERPTNEKEERSLRKTLTMWPVRVNLFPKAGLCGASGFTAVIRLVMQCAAMWPTTRLLLEKAPGAREV